MDGRRDGREGGRERSSALCQGRAYVGRPRHLAVCFQEGRGADAAGLRLVGRLVILSGRDAKDGAHALAVVIAGVVRRVILGVHVRLLDEPERKVENRPCVEGVGMRSASLSLTGVGRQLLQLWASSGDAALALSFPHTLATAPDSSLRSGRSRPVLTRVAAVHKKHEGRACSAVKTCEARG